ncbi:uncharacterized protein FOMMEDRAFT_153641 [Fomitiporia mediterranea MF3/22]|uniref:uncharacterized protein n=1 Tax=Fomitiporia mediterranea (strain MF3/22) TaxID=694068 RepID=UPI000440737B|nr:uncharacterized protein FOMMEDRAFT_153641 [Fomitiporia mediterranea MF3/22]EJD06239.1 hypothetical protein FOMMEDRAFT_153641 [Fomitiporia mediterranea MF3/22]
MALMMGLWGLLCSKLVVLWKMPSLRVVRILDELPSQRDFFVCWASTTSKILIQHGVRFEDYTGQLFLNDSLPDDSLRIDSANNLIKTPAPARFPRMVNTAQFVTRNQQLSCSGHSTMNPPPDNINARSISQPYDVLRIIFQWATFVPNAFDIHEPDSFAYPAPWSQEKIQAALFKSMCTNYRLALVCKAWNDVATPLLYRSICIGTRKSIMR